MSKRLPRTETPAPPAVPAFPGAAHAFVVRRPMLMLGICWTIGVLLGRRFPGAEPGLILSAAFCLAFAIIRRKQTGRASLAMYMAVLLSAGAYAGFRMQTGPDHLASHMPRERAYATVGGWVDGDVSRRPVNEQRETLVVPFRVDTFETREGPQAASGRLTLYWTRHPDPRLPGYGQRLKCSGILHRDLTAPADQPARLSAREDEVIILPTCSGNALVAACKRARVGCSALLERGIETYARESGVIQALLLGYRDRVDEQDWEGFAASGLLHIFAISGLHIGVWAALVMGLCRVLGLSRERWIWVIAPVLLLYTAATGLKPSSVRACVMALTFFSAFAVGRRPDAWSALGLAAMLILAADPFQVGEPGFILSFVIVAGLLLFCGPVYRGLLAWSAPDPWRLSANQRPGPGRRAWHSLAGLAAASLTAWIVSLPLSMFFFNRITPSGLLGNLVVVPGAFLVVSTGVVSMVTGTVWPVAGEVFNHANRVFVHLMLVLVDSLESLPGGHAFVRSPPAAWVALYYTALLAARFTTRRKTAAAAIAGCLAFGLGWIWAPHPPRMDIIDAGAGQAILLDRCRGGDVLLDTGPRFQARNLVGHLRRRGINRLDILVISHADTRHAGGVPAILEQWPVRELWIPPHFGETRAYRDLVAQARKAGTRVVERQAGQSRSWSDGLLMEVLHPAADDLGESRRGNRSLVLRIAREGASVLVMGGAEQRAEEILLQRPIDLSASVLVMGDQGSAGTASHAWLDAVRPDVAVISTGAYNRNGCPDAEVLDRLNQAGIPVWRTDRNGGVSVALLRYNRKGRSGPPVRLSPLPD